MRSIGVSEDGWIVRVMIEEYDLLQQFFGTAPSLLGLGFNGDRIVHLSKHQHDRLIVLRNSSDRCRALVENIAGIHQGFGASTPGTHPLGPTRTQMFDQREILNCEMTDELKKEVERKK